MALPWQEELDRAIDAQAARIIEVRRQLHAHPEPSGAEYETTAYLLNALSGPGHPARPGPDRRGVLAEGPGTAPAPRVALRGDIDALRLHEARDSPYRSRNVGLMHACGHDGHAAAVFGALLGLRALRESEALPWPVAWRGIFQPAEETSAGALEMIEAGALEGVSAIFSLHMDPSRAVERIGLRAGALTATCDEIHVTVTGRGGHAARPHESLDPIVGAAQLISSLYLGIPRAVDTQDPVVATIGQVIAGDNPNVIPEQAELRGTLRTLGEPVRQRAKDQIRQIARGVAETTGTRIDVRFDAGPGSVMNDPEMTEILREAATGVLGPDGIDAIPRPSMGGEDFAFYLLHVPGAMFRLGCASPAAGDAPLHSPRFDLDERALLVGAKILARAAVLFCDPTDPRHSRR